MNHLILVNKPEGMTSHDVVNFVRRSYGIKRVGHTGTLDPLAKGLLVICLGEATKLVPFLEQDDKIYDVEIMLGQATTTGDLEGEVIEEVAVPNITAEAVDQVLERSIGEIVQTPPMFSAIKVKGKKLYEYARKNQIVEIPTRKVEIFALKRTSDVTFSKGKCIFSFIAHVSKGTYIRSLCESIAKALGFPGVMKDLTRLQSGKFKLSDASTLEEVQMRQARPIDMLAAIKYPIVPMSDELAQRIKNGMEINPSQVINNASPIAFSYQGKLLAIYELDEIKNVYKAVRIWL